MFNFLWSGKNDKEGIHLEKWELLSQPKCLGGWGFKNLYWFGLALTMKSLWRALIGYGIWNHTIKDKYFKNRFYTN